MRQNSAYLLLYERKALLGALRRMPPAGSAVGMRSSAVGEEKGAKTALNKSEATVKGMSAEEKGINSELKSEAKSEAKGVRDTEDADDKFTSDSWDAGEADMEADREAKGQQKEEHTREEVESALEESRVQKMSVSMGDADLPPIAKKVLQAVWTENLEFQTDRSLFNR